MNVKTIHKTSCDVIWFLPGTNVVTNPNVSPGVKRVVFRDKEAI